MRPGARIISVIAAAAVGGGVVFGCGGKLGDWQSTDSNGVPQPETLASRPMVEIVFEHSGASVSTYGFAPDGSYSQVSIYAPSPSASVPKRIASNSCVLTSDIRLPDPQPQIDLGIVTISGPKSTATMTSSDYRLMRSGMPLWGDGDLIHVETTGSADFPAFSADIQAVLSSITITGPTPAPSDGDTCNYRPNQTPVLRDRSLRTLTWEPGSQSINVLMLAEDAHDHDTSLKWPFHAASCPTSQSDVGSVELPQSAFDFILQPSAGWNPTATVLYAQAYAAKSGQTPQGTYQVTSTSKLTSPLQEHEPACIHF